MAGVDVGGAGGAGEAPFKISSPMLTFESLLDKFLEMFEDLSSSVLDLEVGPSGGVTVVDSRT